jgi:hypothetical protein
MTTHDKGFDFFYRQAKKVDETMHQNDFAESIVANIVKDFEINQ